MKSQYILPISIVVFGLLIAGAVFLVSQNGGNRPTAGNEKVVRTVDSTDHVYGNPNAPVKIVEYADLECPYCKDFQSTMDKLMQYYGPSGKVAWVFRSFPLAQIHSKAPTEAAAAECAAAQGGDSAFFKFIDRLYSVTPSENGLDLTQLPVIATDVGLDGAKLSACVSAGTYTQKVQATYAEAIAEGAQGTPHIVVMTSAGAVLTLDGDQPYSSMRAAVDQILAAIGESVATSTSQ